MLTLIEDETIKEFYSRIYEKETRVVFSRDDFPGDTFNLVGIFQDKLGMEFEFTKSEEGCFHFWLKDNVSGCYFPSSLYQFARGYKTPETLLTMMFEFLGSGYMAYRKDGTLFEIPYFRTETELRMKLELKGITHP